ncbi:NADH-ubiquinone oxidoreductase subunit [Phycomyces blakesleeanus]|uniref:NADH-ubiquinone oxidoreductase subunit n=2 Tax=Phycomyces blakesleeanus TaxID=4837 RepID=A0A167N0E3_PHYB8|nr:NADH-ubiquinone oxidoreductase subunit [Phycomyces blakesleeanus NRRL 1555(-)]OAD74669.1 NADH-ubiquinone oxidoreductase subunit [Phycomyces blakesleeanus NRRL 1555(-)]|eukprot:XP_018292709.1 NADH-ubiquinone oxidoreductase subunit [Phycomyces blakesleeanus NRRL 1555(-)]
MSWNTKTWAWVKKYFSVNPLVTDGIPVVGQFRTPAVGSRPEKYVYPKSAASNISGNYYFQRDTRRNYPRLAIYTQQEVAGLIEGGSVKASIPAVEGQTAVEVTNPKPLVEVLNSHKLYSAQKPAPTPNWGRKMEWKESKDFVYPEDGSFFPMKVYTM